MLEVEPIMPHFQFLPWCRLDRDYEVGDITLRRFTRDQTMDGVDVLTWHRICRILGSYKSHDGTPVKEAVVIQYLDNTLLYDLSDDHRNETIKLVQLATFAGLANRDYFGHFRDFPANRCNSSDFQLFVQAFNDEPTSTNMWLRTPEGFYETRHWPTAALSVGCPIHATNQPIKLDEALVNALLRYREKAEPKDWGSFADAITYFNFANTGEGTVLPQVEWVLLLSAFQRGLHAEKEKSKGVAAHLRDKLNCTRRVMAKHSKRLDGKNDADEPLMYYWMKEFYDLRGEYAHGKLIADKRAYWSQAEHLCLARLAFPMLIRCLLKAKEFYKLKQHDCDQLAVFEPFASEDFLSEENVGVAVGESLWARLLAEKQHQKQRRQLKSRMKAGSERERHKTRARRQ